MYRRNEIPKRTFLGFLDLILNKINKENYKENLYNKNKAKYIII
jgi:hypothetical protein